MTPARFEKIARAALQRLPEEFRPFAEQVLLLIEPAPSEALRRELELPDDEDVFGLYSGPALTERHVDDAPEIPTITLFYEPLLDYCETEEELIHEIQVTVLHEMGHHFGLDEEQLEQLGFG